MYRALGFQQGGGRSAAPAPGTRGPGRGPLRAVAAVKGPRGLTCFRGQPSQSGVMSSRVSPELFDSESKSSACLDSKDRVLPYQLPSEEEGSVGARPPRR